VAQRVGAEEWHFAYQSASCDDWLGPDILEKLEENFKGSAVIAAEDGHLPRYLGRAGVVHF